MKIYFAALLPFRSKAWRHVEWRRDLTDRVLFFIYSRREEAEAKAKAKKVAEQAAITAKEAAEKAAADEVSGQD